MILIEKTEVHGWEAAIRGMRNPMNSWDRSDTVYMLSGNAPAVGENDYDLMKRLACAGTEHAKYRRMITVTADITAPLYWWKEFDTYKVGTVANSCSTMHKVADKEFDVSDFSHEHLCESGMNLLERTVDFLNDARRWYLDTKNKSDWWQMIQSLPSTYNQKRTVQLNYEVLSAMHRQRRNHKLDEWVTFCLWVEGLPYESIITA